MKLKQSLQNEIKYDAQGLIPAIAQSKYSGTVLMLAYMNALSLAKTIETGFVHYWSRSRQTLWFKGETSGNRQVIKSIELDCDGDTLLLSVEEEGPACHTGAPHCFFRNLVSCLLVCVLLTLPSHAGLFAVSQEQELSMGRQASVNIEKQQKIYSDPATNSYINKIGQKLVKASGRSDIPYSFKVVQNKEINAFALPGGYIYVHTGLIKAASSENELAGVIAHEVAHVAARHSAEQIEKANKANLGLSLLGFALSASRIRGGGTLMNGAQFVTGGFFNKFSRDAEREADRLGASYLKTAGWNASGMVSFFEKLSKQKNSSNSIVFFSSHPSSAERVENIGDLIADWGKTGVVDTPEFQKIKKSLL